MSNRRWFQIHLSTAIVLMFVAGVLIWANIQISERRSFPIFERGWPVTAQIGNSLWPLNLIWTPPEFRAFMVKYEPFAANPPSLLQGEWHLRGILLNFLTLAISIAVVALLCEIVIRRRERRTT